MIGRAAPMLRLLVAITTTTVIQGALLLPDVSVSRNHEYSRIIGCSRVSEPVQSSPPLDSTRRQSVLVGLFVALTPRAAMAASGDAAKIELPNPYTSMVDRATKQCLVESLGNRECLVYADDANKLYQGADSRILLERIEKSSQALSTIPTLVSSKKWSQISGVLTGPLGELVQNLRQVAALQNGSSTDASKTTDSMIGTIKKDLYAMMDGVTRKDSKAILKYHLATTNDIVSFIKEI
jgi:hypothetical protein